MAAFRSRVSASVASDGCQSAGRNYLYISHEHSTNFAIESLLTLYPRRASRKTETSPSSVPTPFLRSANVSPERRFVACVVAFLFQSRHFLLSRLRYESGLVLCEMSTVFFIAGFVCFGANAAP